MRELLTMWTDRKMVLTTVVVAVSYAFLLVPFKGLAVIPGFSSVRPAAALPVVFGLLFGPAAAWGAAFGNLAGDLLGGTYNAVTPYGFAGNFLLGLVGYKLWGGLGRLSTGDPPDMSSGEQFPEYATVTLVAAALVGNVVAWGGEVTGTVPFATFAVTVTATDFLAGILVGPPMLFFLYPRVRAAGLLYHQGSESGGNEGAAPAAVAVVVLTLLWTVSGVTASLLAPAVCADPWGSPCRPLRVALGAVALALVVVSLARCGDADW